MRWRLRSASARRGRGGGHQVGRLAEWKTISASATLRAEQEVRTSAFAPGDPPLASRPDPHHERRWLILGVIGIAQLMVVLDATIVNIALPSAQKDLGFSDDSRQWIITAYALAFGSLLLLGGRLGDLFGRKWAFIGGLIGFSVASAIGGAADSFGVLVAARALQGASAPCSRPRPSACSATTFTDPPERGKAFGIFGAIAGGGAAVGLLLGGILTEALSWRWCLYVNLALRDPGRDRRASACSSTGAARPPARSTSPARALATPGLFALVYGFSNSETHSWGHPVTIIMLAARRRAARRPSSSSSRASTHPLLPLRVVARPHPRRGVPRHRHRRHRDVRGLPLPHVLPAADQGLHADPVRPGVPADDRGDHRHGRRRSTSSCLAKVGPRPLLVLGMPLGAVAMVWLAQLDADSSYVGHVLPACSSSASAWATSSPRRSPARPTAWTARHGRRLGDGQHDAAGRRVDRHRAAELDLRQLRRSYAERPRAPAPQLAAEAAVHGYTVAFWSPPASSPLGA